MNVLMNLFMYLFEDLLAYSWIDLKISLSTCFYEYFERGRHKSNSKVN
jgi:hypothetical protein